MQSPAKFIYKITIMSLTNLPFSHLDDSDFAAVIYEFRNGPVHFGS